MTGKKGNSEHTELEIANHASPGMTGKKSNSEHREPGIANHASDILKPDMWRKYLDPFCSLDCR